MAVYNEVSLSVVQGRGLGRMFLRHLRRTRAILHVVDAATGLYPVLSLPCLLPMRKSDHALNFSCGLKQLLWYLHGASLCKT